MLSSATQDLCDALLHLPPGLGTTYAVVVEVGGSVVYEGYNGSLPLSQTTVQRNVPLLSWSMAKSVVHLLAGLAHDDGLVDLDGPAQIEEWQNDERSGITVRHLLQMTSGLKWNEAYQANDATSDVVEMLFRDGRHDVGAYAAASPLIGEPGSTWVYSSGSTNIVCRILRDVLGGAGTDTISYLNERLLVPAGITPVTNAQCRLDSTGTWVGSTFLYLPALDWARLGRMMLNNGNVGDRQVVGHRWITEARSEGARTGEQYRYSNHWWLWPEHSAKPDAFAALGYEGQHLVMVPSTDAVVVRLGATPDELKPWVRAFIHRIIETL